MGSLVYTYAGTISRQTYESGRETWLPANAVGPTLDGMAYLKAAYPGDYAGIQWLNAHAQGAEVVAEAPMCGNCAYTYVSRVAQFTGLADIQNGIHEGEQRFGDELNRTQDVDTLYNTSNPALAFGILRRYDVRYIFVGFIETHCTLANGQQAICYPKRGIAKFTHMVGNGLRIAFHAPGITIYETTGLPGAT
jgi:uncharacterized membrane protein